jgi:hypothetical protein
VYHHSTTTDAENIRIENKAKKVERRGELFKLLAYVSRKAETSGFYCKVVAATQDASYYKPSRPNDNLTILHGHYNTNTLAA